MKLTQLRDLVAIVKHGSLRSAARHLELAQPALTRSIRTLERELGVTLFEREVRGMVLTAAGRLFYERAAMAMNQLKRATEELGQSQGDMQGTVSVGLSIMPHVGMLPAALPVFRRKFPKIKLHIIEGLYPAIEAGLRNGTVDFYMGATPQSLVAPGLVSEKLFENTRTIVCRKNHPLAKAKSIRDLTTAQWATTSLSHNASDDLNALFDSFGMSPPEIMLQAQSTMSVMVALAHTDLLAILPVQWNEFPLTRGHLQVIPVQESLPAPDVVCIRSADLPMTPAAEHLYDLLRRHGPD